MKRSSIIVKALVLTMACSMVLGIAACGGKKKEETSATTESTTETTPMETLPPTEATTTLLEYGQQLPPNDVEVKWKEDPMDPKVMYVINVKTYLKVRKGPGTDYEQVGSLTPGMEVIVVAKTDTNWYKTEDGFYVSCDYIGATKGA